MNISKLFKSPFAKRVNTNFVLLKDAAEKAVGEGLLNNNEVAELRAFLKQSLKKGPVTDTVYFNKVQKEGEGLKFSAEFFADPLICIDFTLKSAKKVFSNEELAKQMSNFRESNDLHLNTAAAERASKIRSEAEKRTPLYLGGTTRDEARIHNGFW